MYYLLTLFCLLPILAAAEPNGPRTCRLLFLGATDDAPQKLQLFDGKSSQEVELPRMNLSQVYHLPGGALSLRMLTTAPTKPEDVSPGAPKAIIPEAMMDFYLLIITDSTNKIAPVKMQVIDADSTKFKKGQMMWYNLTGNSVGGQVGSEKLAMKANSRLILNAPAPTTEEYNVKLSFVRSGESQFNPLFEGKWTHDTRTRTILFVFSDGGAKSPRILGFDDYREPTETKAP
jgi:hypothetical protein